MAELYYSGETLTIEESSSKEHINIRFDSKNDFVSFLQSFNTEDIASYTIRKANGDTTEGHGKAISGIVIKFVGNGQLLARIDIVQLSENQILKETIETLATTALNGAEAWASGNKYNSGDVVSYKNSLYKVVQSHTSQSDWTPDVVPALFTRVYEGAYQEDGQTEIQEWVQPTGAHDAYQMDDVVTHNGSTWKSTVDNNVWEPSVYGWDEVIEDA